MTPPDGAESTKKESFSKEIERKYPSIWKKYVEIEREAGNNCFEEDGVYKCRMNDGTLMFYDTRTGNFGVQTRF